MSWQSCFPFLSLEWAVLWGMRDEEWQHQVPFVPCSLGAVACEGAGHTDREPPGKQAAVWAETTPFPKGEGK